MTCMDLKMRTELRTESRLLRISKDAPDQYQCLAFSLTTVWRNESSRLKKKEMSSKSNNALHVSRYRALLRLIKFSIDEHQNWCFPTSSHHYNQYETCSSWRLCFQILWHYMGHEASLQGLQIFQNGRLKMAYPNISSILWPPWFWYFNRFWVLW